LIPVALGLRAACFDREITMPVQMMFEKIAVACQKTNFARFGAIAGVRKNL
jgi:hypothetical protein